jgi:hypothetical protein
MPRWKTGAKEFTVGVNYFDARGYQSSIPIPVIDRIGEPKTKKLSLTTIRILSSSCQSRKAVKGR